MLKKINVFILLLFFIIIFIEKIFNSYDSYTQDLKNINLSLFQKGHILGTDYLGRDLFSRLVDGILLSLTIVILVLITSLIFSLIFGSIMGYFGSYIDSLGMFFIEIFMSVPSIIITIFILIFMGNSILLLIFSLSFSRSLRLTLLVRNEVKKISILNYVTISKIMGASSFYIIRKHIIPNIIDIILIRMSLMIPGIVFSEAFLSFMGIGVRLPKASLGNLISTSFNNLFINPLQFIITSFSLILICFIFGGFYSDRS